MKHVFAKMSNLLCGWIFKILTMSLAFLHLRCWIVIPQFQTVFAINTWNPTNHYSQCRKTCKQMRKIQSWLQQGLTGTIYLHVLSNVSCCLFVLMCLRHIKWYSIYFFYCQLKYIRTKVINECIPPTINDWSQSLMKCIAPHCCAKTIKGRENGEERTPMLETTSFLPKLSKTHQWTTPVHWVTYVFITMNTVVYLEPYTSML